MAYFSALPLRFPRLEVTFSEGASPTTYSVVSKQILPVHRAPYSFNIFSTHRPRRYPFPSLHSDFSTMAPGKKPRKPLTTSPGPVNRRVEELRSTSRSSTSSSKTTTSTASSDATKIYVKMLAQKRCWNCFGTPVQVCHVVAQADDSVYPSPRQNQQDTDRYQFDFIQDQGLVNFDLCSFENSEDSELQKTDISPLIMLS